MILLLVTIWPIACRSENFSLFHSMSESNRALNEKSHFSDASVSESSDIEADSLENVQYSQSVATVTSALETLKSRHKNVFIVVNTDECKTKLKEFDLKVST
jgi:hypothetical protein